MDNAELSALASTLNRPTTALAGLSSLDPSQIASLQQIIEAATARKLAAQEAALTHALPWPLRGPILAFLRR